MAKFEVGKTYSGEGIEIIIIKRTDKTLYFKFTKPNWLESDTFKIFKKKISFENLEHETIHLGSHWSAPRIIAEEA